MRNTTLYTLTYAANFLIDFDITGLFKNTHLKEFTTTSKVEPSCKSTAMDKGSTPATVGKVAAITAPRANTMFCTGKQARGQGHEGCLVTGVCWWM